MPSPTHTLSADQAKALCAYKTASDWGQSPRDAGQLINITWGHTVDYIYERREGGGLVSVIAYVPHPLNNRWEPWEGIIPVGRWIGVIYHGEVADEPATAQI